MYWFGLAILSALGLLGETYNQRIRQDYREMSITVADSVAITVETRRAFQKFFLFCSRTHVLISFHTLEIVMVYGLFPSPSTFTLALGWLLAMVAIHRPQAQATNQVLQRFFMVDLSGLEDAIAARVVDVLHLTQQRADTATNKDH